MKFFRIIPAEVTTRSKLRLPHKFVERYGKNMPGIVSLEVSTGVKWRVEVKKKEDEVWFGKGWSEFAESLSLKYGHFLTFDYDDMHAVFHVVVINMSAAEIEYPALSCIDAEDHDQGGSRGSACHPKISKVEKEDVVMLIDEDDSNLGRKRSNNVTRVTFREEPRKTKKGSKSKNVDENMSGDIPTGSENETLKTDQTTIKKGSWGKEIILSSEGRIQYVVQGRKVKQSRSEKVLAKAKEFKAQEPVCIIVLQPSYVSQESDNGPKKNYRQLMFPLCFIKAYFNLTCNDATLTSNDGQMWSVKYHIRHPRCHLTIGWGQFTVDNNLRPGDVCLFELISEAENALKVFIFRSTDEV